MFFGRQWLCLMFIHFKDLRKAVRILPKSTELLRGSPFLAALLPPDPLLSILSQEGTEGSCRWCRAHIQQGQKEPNQVTLYSS